MSHSPQSPRQGSLFLKKTKSPSFVFPQTRIDADNRLAAEIILADPARAGGESALPVIWARRFQGRIERSA
jgi:hypothetical protein